MRHLAEIRTPIRKKKKKKWVPSRSINPTSRPPQSFRNRRGRKMSEREASEESEAPEELTSEQGILQDEGIRKVQKENKARVVREGKERRRLWAERKTPRPSKESKTVQADAGTEAGNESLGIGEMLPNDIVQLLAAHEKKVFLSDSEDEKAEPKPHPRKKKPKSSGVEAVILKDISPPPCLQNSLEFLKQKKMQVSRSPAVLNNSNQALRLISNSGLLSKK